jgi:hypothetical protein
LRKAGISTFEPEVEIRRKLKAAWSIETAQDLKTGYGSSLVMGMKNALVDAMANAVTYQLIIESEHERLLSEAGIWTVK